MCDAPGSAPPLHHASIKDELVRGTNWVTSQAIYSAHTAELSRCQGPKPAQVWRQHMNVMENYADKDTHLVLVHGIGHDSTACQNATKFWSTRFPRALVTSFAFLPEHARWGDGSFQERAECLLDTILKDRRKLTKSAHDELMSAQALPCVILGHDLGCALAKQALVIASEDAECGSLASDAEVLFFFQDVKIGADPGSWEHQLLHLLSSAGLSSNSPTELLRELPGALEELSWAFAAIQAHHRTVDICDKMSSQKSPVGIQQLHSTSQTSAPLDNRFKSLIFAHGSLVRRLSKISFSNHQIRLSRPSMNSFDWILHHKSVSDWRSYEIDSPKLLHISGPPGSGKIEASSRLISFLRETTPTSIILTYAFVNQSLESLPKRDLYISLIRQILLSCPSAFPRGKPISTWITHQTVFSVEMLEQLLLFLLEGIPNLPIFFAIHGSFPNESSDGTELINLLKTRQDLSSVCKLLLINEDQAYSIGALGDNKPNCRYIDIIHDANYESTLEGYIGSKIEHLIHIRPEYALGQTDILEKLIQTNSSFLQATISLKLLEIAQIPTTRAQILGYIGKLTMSLTDTYKLAFHDGQKRCAIPVLPLLQWITFAVRPLYQTELAVVAALIIPGQLSGDFLSANISLNIGQDIRCLRGTLIKLVGSKVYPLHQSLRHAFTDQDNHDSKDPDGAILDRLLDYLEFVFESTPQYEDVSATEASSVISDNGDVKPLPLEGPGLGLSRYAVSHWPDHYKRMRGRPEVKDRILTMFEKENNLNIWSRLYHQYIGHIDIDFNHVLDIAGRFGLTDLVVDIVRRERQSSTHTEEELNKICSNSLEIAVIFNNQEVVEMLLDYGAESSDIICLAVRHGPISMIKRLIELRPELINQQSSAGNTPLLIAAREGRIRVADFLLQKGADISAVPEYPPGGYTMQHCFAATGNTSALRLLIDAGVDMNVQSFGGWTPLLTVVGRRAEESLKLLLEHSDIGARLVDGRSALHIAAYSGYESICDILLDAGADDQSLSNDEYTPLHEAAMGGNLVVLRKFLSRSEHAVQNQNEAAEPELSAPFDPAKERNELLHIAARNNHLEIVQELLKDNRYASKRKCSTAVLWAAQRGYIEVVATLLASGKVMAVQDYEGNTALHRAAANQSQAIVELLLQSTTDFDINALNKPQETPLHCAARSGRLWTVQTLLNPRRGSGARADLKSKSGQTALHVAASYGHTAITAALLEHPDMKDACLSTDDDGDTALILAVREGHVETLEAFLPLLSKHTPQDLQGPKDAWYAAVEADGEKCIPVLLHNKWPMINDDSSPRATALHQAAKKDEVDLMELLCKNGAKIEARTLSGDTPLHWAAEHDSKGAVRFLLNRGATIDPHDDEWVTPLWKAAYDGSYDSVQELLNASPKPDVNVQKRSNGWTPLHAAYDRGDITKLLLDAGADPRILNEAGNPAFYEAADHYRGHEIIQHHLDAGMDPTMRNKKGQTILHVTGDSGSRSTVELLVARGSDINARDDEGIAPIHVAILDENLEVVQCLVEKNADLEVDCQRYGTPLMAAVQSGNTEIMKMLLDRSARVNNFSHEHIHHTPLQAAAANRSHDYVRLLLEHGADVNITGGTFGSPLCAAVRENAQDCIESLLEAGADVNFVGPQGTALEMAIANDSWAVVDLLLGQDIDPNSTSRGRYGTALIAAINSGNFEYVGKLLSRGANPNVQAEGRESTTEAAVKKGDTEIFNKLLMHGMEINCQDPSGRGPLSHAIVWKSLDLVEILWDREEIDLDEQDFAGRTPLMLAVIHAPDMVGGLISRHVDVNAKDKLGRTALVYAIRQDYDDLVEDIIKAGADPLMTNNRGRDSLYWAALGSSRNSFDVILKAVQDCGDSIRRRDSVRLAVNAAIAGENPGFIERLLEELDSDWQLADSDDWSPPYTAMRYDQVGILASTSENLGHGPLFRSLETTDPQAVPREWHASDHATALLREPNPLSITVQDPPRENEYPQCIARADHPMVPGASGVYYFEVTIVYNLDDSDVLGIGFCREDTPLEDEYLGFVDGSWGVHHDDGKAYGGSRAGAKFSEGFDNGDVIGCGVNFVQGIAFYTRNGTVIGQAFDNIRGRLYPAICTRIGKAGCVLRAQFWDYDGNGNSGFMFKGPYDGDETRKESKIAQQAAEEDSSSSSSSGSYSSSEV
ncbi:hypothetical protein PFICI_08749 [Pestalotiopsis fici W106-1]|uniref:B30.2/SPRY domain-containing protein n=1 Tax=Pestalotiopsis fici (strain W106-1 / CGMCC3.15140) TaxID=1229662 RepID=W3X156_PESFW|nr:uncharacterized protein PFICI_08749 [Pestalotiopsis fici W106-1]ETS78896.1 hypothetical protein PFICI_08749 [Pestalotiopsis fici W106-1]